MKRRPLGANGKPIPTVYARGVGVNGLSFVRAPPRERFVTGYLWRSGQGPFMRPETSERRARFVSEVQSATAERQAAEAPARERRAARAEAEQAAREERAEARRQRHAARKAAHP